jgi:hypothetical protein
VRCRAGLAGLAVMVPVAPAAVQQVVHALTLGSEVALGGKNTGAGGARPARSQGTRQITAACTERVREGQEVRGRRAMCSREGSKEVGRGCGA